MKSARAFLILAALVLSACSGSAPSADPTNPAGPAAEKTSFRDRCVWDICADSLPEEFASTDELYGTLSRIRQRIASPDVTIGDRASCHNLLHEVGRVAARSDLSYEQMLGNFDNTCASAYLHGVMERFAEGMTREELDVATVEFCGLFPENKLSLCWHGYGHAIGNHLMSDLSEQIETCGTMGEEGITYCVSGLFMGIAEQSAEYVRELAPDNDFCRDLSGEFLRSCAEQQWNLFGRLNIPVEEFEEHCAATVGEERDYCYRGLGQIKFTHALGAAMSQGDPHAARLRPELCDGLGEQQENCLLGMARSRAGVFLGAGYDAALYESVCPQLDVDQAECRRVEDLVESNS